MGDVIQETEPPRGTGDGLPKALCQGMEEQGHVNPWSSGPMMSGQLSGKFSHH